MYCFESGYHKTSTSFSSNVGQFGAGTAPETPALDFYVKGESGAPQMQDDNLLSGKVYYYSETQKAGCWHYDDNGNAELWA